MGDLWTIVLAGGEGRRLSAVTGGVPKQFWRGLQRLSLLELTVNRFAPLSHPANRVVLVAEQHRAFLADRPPQAAWDTTIFQPDDRGTAVAVMLALLPILDRDRHALVVVTPADHGVNDHREFTTGILEAAAFARTHSTAILFGVTPTSTHQDYGWISPGRTIGRTPFRQVDGFIEKPRPDLTAKLMADGAVWNTMVLVARADFLWQLCAAQCPVVAGVFARASRLRPEARPRFITHAYQTLPRHDFSHEVLARSPGLVTYVWPDRMGWSDLGTPQGLHAWLTEVQPQHVA